MRCYKCGGHVNVVGGGNYWCVSCYIYMPNDSRCPYCGKGDLAYGSQFCPGCGKKQHTCKGCGRTIGVEVARCPHCGQAAKYPHKQAPKKTSPKPVTHNEKKTNRYYIKSGDKYYTSCDNWSSKKANGIYFSNSTQAANVIKAAHLKGAYVSYE